MKKEKTKYEGAKNILQIVEKLLNSGTLAVSSCTNLALIKTAASLENTFIFQNKQKRKKTVEIWKNSKYFATWDLSLGNASPPQMITIISFLLKYYLKEKWDFIYERFVVSVRKTHCRYQKAVQHSRHRIFPHSIPFSLSFTLCIK